MYRIASREPLIIKYILNLSFPLFLPKVWNKESSIPKHSCKYEMPFFYKNQKGIKFVRKNILAGILQLMLRLTFLFVGLSSEHTSVQNCPAINNKFYEYLCQYLLNVAAKILSNSNVSWFWSSYGQFVRINWLLM